MSDVDNILAFTTLICKTIAFIVVLLFMLLVAGSIGITYIVSILGWIQTRLNINEEEIEDFNTFIRRYNLIGLGTILIFLGVCFYFFDWFIPKIDPAVSITILFGYIIQTIGMINFYIAFRK